jgi:hypothetical protein
MRGMNRAYRKFGTALNIQIIGFQERLEDVKNNTNFPNLEDNRYQDIGRIKVNSHT